jgi:signal transduction histidine kinase
MGMTSVKWAEMLHNQLMPKGARYTYLLQLCFLAAALLTVILLISLIPNHYALLKTCLFETCEYTPAPPTTVAELSAFGLTPVSYSSILLISDCLFMLFYIMAAFLIYWRGRQELMALLASVMLLCVGTTFSLLVPSLGNSFAERWFKVVAEAGWLTFFLFFFLFPSGRVKPGWVAIPALATLLLFLAGIIFPGSPLDRHQWAPLGNASLFIIPIILIVFVQFYRYKHGLTPSERQQSKWVVFGITVSFTAFIVISLAMDPAVVQSPLSYLMLNVMLYLFMLMIPLTLTLAVLKRRLWEVDPVVNRTLVYVAVSVCVISLYSFTVWYLGSFFQSKGNFLISLLAAGLVAVVFAPLKEKLQRLVNRFMKGRHDDPYGVLTEISSQLLQPLSHDAMLDAVVRTVRTSLQIPYASITIEINGQDREIGFSGTKPQTECRSFPIIHRGKFMGTLQAANRQGEAFTPEDMKLLEIILGHAGPIIENVSMTMGMQLLADDLQHSREQLVLAREEERRYIRRNLHDELAPRLAAIGLNASAAEMYVERNPAAAVTMLTELRKVIRSTVEDIRTLVHDLHPASLDESGLIGAIQERIDELSTTLHMVSADGGIMSLRIELQAPNQFKTMPAAVEVAAYRIVTEALANVVRHSEATFCRVKLELVQPELLQLEVTDNGKGITEKELNFSQGIGLRSIRERAVELGGHCTIERLLPNGTKVLAQIPLPKGED